MLVLLPGRRWQHHGAGAVLVELFVAGRALSSCFGAASHVSDQAPFPAYAPRQVSKQSSVSADVS